MAYLEQTNYIIYNFFECEKFKKNMANVKKIWRPTKSAGR